MISELVPLPRLAKRIREIVSLSEAKKKAVPETKK